MLKKLLDPEIDYAGQIYSKRLMISVFAVGYFISFLIGILLQNLKYTLFGGIFTVSTCFLLTVPAWAHFRTNPLHFKKYKKE